MSTRPTMSNILQPSWINWDARDQDGKCYYRKLTNLHGGIPGSGEMNWLSYFSTTPNDKEKKSYNDMFGPQFQQEPENLWFFDARTKKLKISNAKDPLTYSVDPLADTCGCSGCGDINIPGGCEKCGDKSGANKCDEDSGYGCCANSSANRQCVYRWHRQQGASGSKTKCGGTDWKDDWKGGVVGLLGDAFKKSNHWDGPYTGTCDHWSYMTNHFIEVPEGGTQDINGTFCVNTQNEGVYMRTYLGCDCDRKGEFKKFRCTNMQGGNCDSTEPDDKQIVYSKFPAGERGIWQFIDDEAAFACCSQSDVKNFPQCQFAFNPNSSTNKCPAVAQQYCAGNWGVNSDIGNACQGFLVGSGANYLTTQQTIQNYITSRSTVGQPQDYISYDLWKAGNPLATQYYESRSTMCYPSKEANGCELDPTNDCCRDDATDPFFTDTMPYMCNFQYEPSHESPRSSMAGVCDKQLQYFCQSFTREDLAADLTLQNICGCNLLTNPNSQPYNPDIEGTKPMELQRCSKNTNPPICDKPSVSPYYVNANTAGDNCDIICNTSLIQTQTLGGKCTQPVCTIDAVTINQINSNTGDTTITQDCSGGTCYIVGVDINEIGSNTGANNIIQDCGSCYYTSSNDLINAQPYDCGTLQPIVTPTDGGNVLDDEGLSGFLRRNWMWIIIVAIVIGLIVWFIASSYFRRKMQLELEKAIPKEGIIIGDEYWDQY